MELTRQQISDAVDGHGWCLILGTLQAHVLAGSLGMTTRAAGGPRAPQGLEIGIDALDIAAVRPFWKAVLSYAEYGGNVLADPLGGGPAVWFQQMDAPRPQRNRIHLDVSVPFRQALPLYSPHSMQTPA